ncbi:MAG: hypothetical protein ABI308_02780 [Mucilaginibacter sp.]
MSSFDPIQLNYLVFDDENEEKNQNALHVKIPGFTCNLVFINPNDFYQVDKDEFDIEGFTNHITQSTQGLFISLIATDWNMLAKTTNYNEINGLQVVEIMLGINQKYRKCPFLIYSGKPNEASQVLISKIQNELNNEDNQPIYSLELLSLLLELRIKFCARNSRFEEIVTIAKGQKSISQIVLNSLEKFNRNTVINTGNEVFDGQTFGSLVDLISQDNDLGLKFIREFIELSIANYSELNA